jgi:hypothetical protein
MTNAHGVMGIQGDSSMAFWATEGRRSILLFPFLGMAAGICEIILHKHLFASAPWKVLDGVYQRTGCKTSL